MDLLLYVLTPGVLRAVLDVDGYTKNNPRTIISIVVKNGLSISAVWRQCGPEWKMRSTHIYDKLQRRKQKGILVLVHNIPRNRIVLE